MTYEEALLSCKLTCTQCQDIYKIQCHEDCATAYKINALEKQIPKKPKLKEKDWGYIRYFEVCPNCGDMIFPENLFCAKCGQALDWSE